jgi:hypothetical protein
MLDILFFSLMLLYECFKHTLSHKISVFSSSRPFTTECTALAIISKLTDSFIAKYYFHCVTVSSAGLFCPTKISPWISTNYEVSSGCDSKSSKVPELLFLCKLFNFILRGELTGSYVGSSLLSLSLSDSSTNKRPCFIQYCKNIIKIWHIICH